ncbi:MAG: thioredoxin family protein [Cytophagales bacterium]|nr:thioredoxin family protein [Cytophagales bacterium]
MKRLFFTLAAVLFLSSPLISEDKESPGYKVGDRAADFKLENVDGKTISLSDYKEAKAFVVIFTCNHCPYSKMYEERIKKLSSKYAGKQVPVIAINPNTAARNDESLQAMKVRAEQKEFNFPYLADADQSVTNMYGATRTPQVFVLDKNMNVQYIGAIDNNSSSAKRATSFYVEDAVDALLEGKKPTVSFTKAIGCSVKRPK